MNLQPRRRGVVLALVSIGVLVLSGLVGAVARGASTTDEIKFGLVRSPGVVAATCLPHAEADVKVETQGANQVMHVETSGLPANTAFVLFVIQVPNAPFGMSWYQGDVDTGADGTGEATFIGRFNIETFVVAPGVAPAPAVFTAPPFPDATSNPATAPVQMYHLGMWFDDPADAVKAGCPGTVTPFNGNHMAGIQVLNTANFANDQGPLRQLP
jgi:hypothetical protein